MKQKLLLTLSALLIFSSLSAQRTITGVVIDEESNEPIPGVNILIKGTFQMVLTNLDGEYSIEIANDTTILIFSFVAFESKEVEVTDSRVINIILSIDNNIEYVSMASVGISLFEKKKVILLEQLDGKKSPNSNQQTFPKR